MKLMKDRIQSISSSSSSSKKLETYIGDGTAVDGSLIAKESLTIYGSVRGSIECQGRVVIGDSGNIEADILANDVVVSGRILGNITAKERLEITSNGSIKGDIKASRLIMEDGCKFDGRCEMLSEGKPAVVEKIKALDTSEALPLKEKPKLPSASHS